MRTVLANAVWNVVNGTSSALVAVLVPPFLTRLLAPEAYGAWALALQIGTYVGLFGFGIQIAVGRYVAYHEARGDIAARDGIVATSFWFLALVALPAWLAVCVLAGFIDQLLPNLSAELVPQTRAAIVLVGLSLAINLPASVFAAVFTGRQRSDVPAKIQGLGRIVLAVGIVLAGLSRNLAVIASVYAVISAATIAALWFAWRYRTATPTLARRHVGRAHGRELFGFCLSLTIWNFSMLLVSGFDLLIVGRYDYAATPYYAVCVTLVTLIAGTISSLANALVPATAAVAGSSDQRAIWLMLDRGSRLIIGVTILAAVPLIFSGDVLLTWWLGSAYAQQASAILALLTLATVTRNLMLPYVTIAIGLSHQKKMIATPVIEGIISVTLSIVLAHRMGAIGVAYAKVISGLCGVALLLAQHCLYDAIGGIKRSTYLLRCVLTPVMAILPPLLLDIVLTVSGTTVSENAKPFIFGIVGLVSVMIFALGREDRTLVADRLRKLVSGRVQAA